MKTCKIVHMTPNFLQDDLQDNFACTYHYDLLDKTFRKSDMRHTSFKTVPM